MKAARLCLTACLMAGLHAVLLSCAGAPVAPEPPVHPTEVAVVQPETKEVPQAKPEPEERPAQTPEEPEQPAEEGSGAAGQPGEKPPAEEPPAEEPPAEEPPDENEKPQEYAVTEEVYSKTFEELESLIREWSAVIARKDYDRWYASLSRAYIAERGSVEYLTELSRKQKLKDANIQLRNLKDYFNNVVVPARVDAARDRIAFVSENKVKAYADIGGEPAILYHVVREDGEWKIGIAGE